MSYSTDILKTKQSGHRPRRRLTLNSTVFCALLLVSTASVETASSFPSSLHPSVATSTKSTVAFVSKNAPLRNLFSSNIGNAKKTFNNSSLNLFITNEGPQERGGTGVSQPIEKDNQGRPIGIKPEFSIPDSRSLQPLSSHPVSSLPNGGRITLVGAGPGDPDLLTAAAYRMLTDTTASECNTLVICDRLISKEIKDVIKGGEIRIARKLPGCADLAQEEIYSWVHEALKQGKHVIRLKIGDPFVFGRGGEEIITYRRFGLEPKVIPGVSAAFAAPLLGSIPVTHRGVSNQVVMCTGYGREGTSPDLIQYHKEQTVVFLMAVGRLRELCQRLIDLAGYPSKTPVAIVEKAGCPDQRTVVGNMETIADLAEKYDVKPPSTIVVGDVVNVLLEKDDVTGETVTGLIESCVADGAATVVTDT